MKDGYLTLIHSSKNCVCVVLYNIITGRYFATTTSKQYPGPVRYQNIA